MAVLLPEFCSSAFQLQRIPVRGAKLVAAADMSSPGLSRPVSAMSIRKAQRAPIIEMAGTGATKTK
jgi:hypothetical protein